MRQPVLILSILLFLPPPEYAQTNGAPAPLIEKINVSVVSVDVTVNDQHGRPVSGLTKDDFEVFEDGQPQKLTNFYRIENAVPQADETAQKQFRRKVVLLVDNNFIEKPQRDAALQRFRDFIDNHFSGGYEWSIAVIGHEVQTIQTFTDSKAELDRALDRALATPTLAADQQTDRDLLNDSGRRGIRDFVGGVNNYDFGETMRFQGREQTLRSLRSTINTGRAIIQTCRAYAAVEGKKLVILITGGMEANTSFSAYEQSSDRNLSDSRLEIGKIFDLITQQANAANFNLYILNARTRSMQAQQHDVTNRSSGVSTKSIGIGNDPSDVHDVDSTSVGLASRTGGLYLPGNDVSENLERVDTQSANFYSLGYRPGHFEDNRYHHIKVVVKRPDVSVLHREGYADLSSDDRIESTLRSPITFAKEKGPLPVAIEVGVPAQDKSSLTVPVVASTPMQNVTFVPRGESFAGRVHIYLAVYDQTGNNVGYHHQIQDLTFPRAALDSAKRLPFRYRLNVRLRKGDFTIAVTLRDDITDEIGTALQSVRF